MNNIKPSFTKQVWLFKLMVLPLAISLIYSITWHVTGDADIAMKAVWIMGVFIITVTFADASVGVIIGAFTIVFAFVGVFAIAVEFAVAFADTGMFAFAGVFAVTFAGAVASAGKDDKKWKISWSSNLISAVLQFFLTWGGLYLAQHLQITWM